MHNRGIQLMISAVAHRSGSTLLQRLCNARKENLIWGEHDGVLTDFIQISDKLKRITLAEVKERKRYFESDENPNLWLAKMAPEADYLESALVSSVRAFFDGFYAQYAENHDIIGFKEVRYGERELQLIRQCYPLAKILLLIRNPVDIWESLLEAWSRNYLETLVQKWNTNTAFYLRFAAEDPSAFLVRYEDIVQRDEQTIDLICSVASINRKQLEAVLAVKLNSTARRRETWEADHIRQHCAALMHRLDYL